MRIRRVKQSNYEIVPKGSLWDFVTDVPRNDYKGRLFKQSFYIQAGYFVKGGLRDLSFLQSVAEIVNNGNILHDMAGVSAEKKLVLELFEEPSAVLRVSCYGVKTRTR